MVVGVGGVAAVLLGWWVVCSRGGNVPLGGEASAIRPGSVGPVPAPLEPVGADAKGANSLAPTARSMSAVTAASLPPDQVERLVEWLVATEAALLLGDAALEERLWRDTADPHASLATRTLSAALLARVPSFEVVKRLGGLSAPPVEVVLAALLGASTSRARDLTSRSHWEGFLVQYGLVDVWGRHAEALIGVESGVLGSKPTRRVGVEMQRSLRRFSDPAALALIVSATDRDKGENAKSQLVEFYDSKAPGAEEFWRRVSLDPSRSELLRRATFLELAKAFGRSSPSLVLEILEGDTPASLQAEAAVHAGRQQRLGRMSQPVEWWQKKVVRWMASRNYLAIQNLIVNAPPNVQAALWSELVEVVLLDSSEATGARTVAAHLLAYAPLNTNQRSAAIRELEKGMASAPATQRRTIDSLIQRLRVR